MSVLAERMALIKSTFAARVPSRVVTRSFKDFSMRSSADLKKGIYTLISVGEGRYQNLRERAAMDGRHRILLTGQIKLDEKSDEVAVEDAEFAMVDEVKAFVRDLPPELACLDMTGFRQSGQIEHPYGWIAVDLEITD